MQLLRDNLTLRTSDMQGDGEEQNKEALQDVEDENQWDKKATTLDLSISPLLEIPLLSLRTSKSDFYIWSQYLSSFPVGFFPFLFFFFNSFQKFLKARVNFCGFYWFQLLGSLRTLTGLHRGFFSITVQWQITIRNGNYIWKILEFYIMQASWREVNHTIEVYTVLFSLFLIV